MKNFKIKSTIILITLMIFSSLAYSADVTLEVLPNGDRLYHFHNGPESQTPNPNGGVISTCAGTQTFCKDVLVTGNIMVGPVIPQGATIGVFSFTDGITMAGYGHVNVTLLQAYNVDTGGPMYYQFDPHSIVYTDYKQWMQALGH